MLLVLASLSSLTVPATRSAAMCNVIPNVSSEFRGALGSIDRPYAVPGEFVTLLEPAACEVAPPATFPPDPADQIVTIVFTPPGGDANAVVLATDCSLVVTGECVDQLGGAASALTCVTANSGLDPFSLTVEETARGRRLRFRFPSTDDRVPGLGLAGPAKIAVSPVDSAVPCDLATRRCSAVSGLLACIDELYVAGSCGTGPRDLDPTFGHFTALPEANDFGALCEPGPVCTGLQDAVRFTADKEGNVLVPMDYARVLVRLDGVPIPRIVRGLIQFPVFDGAAQNVSIPGNSFIGSYSREGHRLPPIFDALADPEATGLAALFGSVDAPAGVIRVARRSPNLRECTVANGPPPGVPCATQDECPSGSFCTTAFCRSSGIPTQTRCASDADCGLGQECGPALFEVRDRFREDELGSGNRVGPIVVRNDEFTLEAESPVPLDGLLASNEMFAFVLFEAIENRDLNGDGDLLDEVVTVRERGSGRPRAVGPNTSSGRSVVRVRQDPFRFAAIAVTEDLVAFLEPERLQGARDANGDGDTFDSILRVFRIGEACSSDTAACEVTGGLDIPAEAAPVINGRSVVASGGLLYFRSREADQARSLDPRLLVAGASPGVQPSLSPDGRDVAFKSAVTRVSVHDRDADGDAVYDEPGATLTTSIAEAGSTLSLSHRAMTEDGRYAVFGPQVTIHDRDADGDGRFDEPGVGETATIALPFLAVTAAISADGRHVAFNSLDATLVSSDTNAARDVLVHDRDADRNGVFDEAGGTRITRVSVDSLGLEASGDSFLGSLSHDGRFVAFASNASNLVDGDANGGTDVFVHDRDFDGNGVLDEDPASIPAARLTERVSVASDGTEGNFNGVAAPFIAPPSISADGRFVTFVSFSSNLVPGDTNGVRDVFVHDRRARVTTRVSLDEVGFQTLDSALSSAISTDGRFVAFDRASRVTDVLLADRVSGLVRRLTGGEGVALAPNVSREGLHVVFGRLASSAGPMGLYAAGADTADAAADLNGDGDVDDTVLRVLEVGVEGAPSLRMLGDASRAAVAGRFAAFLRPEAAIRAADGSLVDENGDGDHDDHFVFLSQFGGVPVPLHREATEIAVSEQLLVALGPGDDGTNTAQIYPLPGGPWIDLEIAADAIDVAGSVVAIREAGSGLLHIAIEGPTGIERRETGRRAVDFVAGDEIVAFRSSEQMEGEGGTDLNADGDREDEVLFVFDVGTRTVLPTEQAATPCRFEICDPRLPYRVVGRIVTFLTLEQKQAGNPGCGPTLPPGGCDLDGDRLGTGVVVQTFNAGSEAAGFAAGRIAASVAPAVTTIAGVEAGICTDTGTACATNLDCPSGDCFLPPGVCIEPRGTVCNPVFGPVCASDEFCEPDPAVLGRGTCMRNFGPCRINEQGLPFCDGNAVCRDSSEDLARLISPLTAETDGRQVLPTSALLEVPGGLPCAGDSGCSQGEVCNEAGTCQDEVRTLVIAGAPDSDSDGIADPFDNCPRRSNADQADLDGDGAGDRCDLASGPDEDDDGVPDGADNCTHTPNTQADFGGVGFTALPDEIGNACQCGDVSGDGSVTSGDTLRIRRALRDPPTASLERPELCDVDGDGRCTLADAETIRKALLSPPAAALVQECGPALPAVAKMPAVPACGLGGELVLLVPLFRRLLRRHREARC